MNFMTQAQVSLRQLGLDTRQARAQVKCLSQQVVDLFGKETHTYT